MTACQPYYLPRSPGARFIFFSWILHELYIKPHSSHFFRFLAFKLCCLSFAVLFFSQMLFVFFRLFLVLFINFCILLPISPKAASSASTYAAVVHNVIKSFIAVELQLWLSTTLGGGGRIIYLGNTLRKEGFIFYPILNKRPL